MRSLMMEYSLLFYTLLLFKTHFSYSFKTTKIVDTTDEILHTVNNAQVNSTAAELELLWLSVSFLNYMRYSKNSQIKSEWGKDEQFVVNQLQPALIDDSMGSSKPIVQLQKKPQVIDAIEDSLMYTKGSSIIRMMKLTFGVSVFNSGMRTYLKLKKYKILTLDDLWLAFQKQIDKTFPINIKTVMDSWTRQAGFPVVNVEINNGIARLSQKRHVLDLNDSFSTNATWWIPLIWASESNPNFSTTPKYWLSKTEDKIELNINNDEWVIFNVQQAGFYRVNYDEVSWHRIIYTITYDSLDKIPAISRAVIINDLFNLAKSESVSFNIALNSLIYINRETDYSPIETALTELEYLYKRFCGRDSEEIFNKFFLALITPIYQRLGFDAKINDDSLTKVLRNRVTDWTCYLGYEECNNIAMQLFFKWKKKASFSIDLNRKSLVFCTAIKHDSWENPNGAIEIITNHYKKSTDLLERAIAIDSLGCIQNTTVLKKIINSALNKNKHDFVRRQEIIFMFKSIVKHNYKSANFIVKFLVENYGKMLKYYGNHQIFDEILLTLSGVTMTQQEAEKMFILFKVQNKSLDQLSDVLNFALKEMNLNNDFLERYEQSIINWIQNNHILISLDSKAKLNSDSNSEIIIKRCFVLFRIFYLADIEPNEFSFTLSDLKNSMQGMSYFLWKRTFKDFEYLIGKINDKNILDILKLHMLAVIKPIYNKLGFIEKENESYEEKLLRVDVIDWACRLEHVDCILNSLKLFHNDELNSKKIPEQLKKIILCTVMKWGSTNDGRSILTSYKIKDPREKVSIKYAIACSKFSIKYKMNQIMKIKSYITIQERLNQISLICLSKPEQISKILDLLCNENLELNSKFDSDQLIKIFEKISFYVSSNEHLKLLKKCMNVYKKKRPELIQFLNLYEIQARHELEQFNAYSTEFINWLEMTYLAFDYRLPKTIKPTKYEIALTPEMNFFFGYVKITLDVLNDISHIVLHANELKLHQINIYNPNTGRDIEVLFFISHRDHRLEIYLNTIVKAGTRLNLTIFYSSTFSDGITGGFFRSSYQDSSGTNHWLFATQFQKNDARRAFPCFDEPAYKARFEISIIRPNHYHTLSNMKLKFSVPSKKRKQWTWDHYEESALMSTYLVAFVICDYEIILHFNNDVRFWSYRSISSYEEYSGRVVEKSLNFLKEYTGISSPMDKLDLVEIPEFYSGGMENWGLILLDDSLKPSIANNSFSNVLSEVSFREFVIAHEVIHTWFGNLVTCETWKYFWLNEGFTRYFEWIIMDSLQPNIKWIDKFIAYVQQVALQLDSLSSSLPLNDKDLNIISDSDVFDHSFTIIIKSASIVRMMQHAFGEDVFHSAVKRYLKENQFNTTTPLDLWFSMQVAVDQIGGLPRVSQNVATLMESWVSQPGYPVVHVIKIDDILMLSQERFLITGRNKSFKELYWIPITIASATNPDFVNTLPIIWMGLKEINITIPNMNDDWIILNIQQAGFYRVNYDMDSWLNIFDTLNKNNFGGIPEINRAQIIDDLFSLARADYITYGLALAGSQYLIKETEHLPWKSFLRAIDILHEKFDNPIVEMKLKNYFVQLIKPMYDRLDFDEKPEDTQLDKLNRALILSWAHKLDISDCIMKSLILFDYWVSNLNEKSIPLDQQTLALCSALRHGNYEVRHFVWEQYIKAEFKSEKVFMLRILGCSQNVTALIKYLHTAVFGPDQINKEDIHIVFSSIFSSRRIAVDASLTFLKMFHNDISKLYAGWTLIDPLFKGIMKESLTSVQISKLQNLIYDIEDENVKKQLNDIVFVTSRRRKWYDKRVDVIENWLVKNSLF